MNNNNTQYMSSNYAPIDVKPEEGGGGGGGQPTGI